MKGETTLRDYKITQKPGEWYRVDVVDSYGKQYHNFYKTAKEAHDFPYYIWENEDKFQEDSMKMLEEAIFGCTKLDEELGLLKGNRDNLD